MRIASLLAISTLLIAYGSVASTTHAALIAYDGFEDGAVGSDVLGKAGGTGFIGPWIVGGFNASIHVNYDIGAGSLSFQSLLTSGNRATTLPVDNIAGLTRDLVQPLGIDGSTRYLSFVLRPEGTLDQGVFNGFFGLVLEQPLEPELFTGKPGADAIHNYVVEDRGGSLQVASGTAPTPGEAALLVLKAEFAAGNDTFTLYMNPVPGGPEPLSGTVKSNSDVGLVNGLTFYSTGAFSIDEIRVGETFADVTPTPEPASLALLGLGALALPFVRRGRNRRLA